MKAKSLKDIALSVGLSRDELANVAAASTDEVDKWFAGEGNPSWLQSLRIMGYLARKPSAYKLPDEPEFEVSSIEELERDLTQAAGISDLLYSSSSQDDISHGALWAVSDKLRACLEKVKSIGRL
ncbi:MAG: hypothetical protein SwStaBPW_32930 [Shewanella algae]